MCHRWWMGKGGGIRAKWLMFKASPTAFSLCAFWHKTYILCLLISVCKVQIIIISISWKPYCAKNHTWCSTNTWESWWCDYWQLWQCTGNDTDGVTDGEAGRLSASGQVWSLRLAFWVCPWTLTLGCCGSVSCDWGQWHYCCDTYMQT